MMVPVVVVVVLIRGCLCVLLSLKRDSSSTKSSSRNPYRSAREPHSAWQPVIITQESLAFRAIHSPWRAGGFLHPRSLLFEPAGAAGHTVTRKHLLQFPTYCLCRSQMILRVFWPCSDLPGQKTCLLLGAVLHSTQKSQAVTTAVIVSVIPLHLLPATPEVQQHLVDRRVAVPLAPAPAQATLAVLGLWQPLEAASSSPGPSAAGQHALWLVLRGRQGLAETLAGSSCWRAQQLWAPAFDLQQCDLPPDTESIQVCSFYPPPSQLGFNREHALIMMPTPLCLCRCSCMLSQHSSRVVQASGCRCRHLARSFHG